MSTAKLFSLKGEVAVVTGGAGFLGPKLCEALAECGASVVLADQNVKKGLRVARETAEAANQTVIFKKADITDETSVHDLVRWTIGRFKKIDILVNTAMGLGRNFYAPIESYSWEDWELTMRVNVGGFFLCMKAVAPYMKNRRKGAIINIGSMYGVVGADQRIYGKSGLNSPAVYAASKGAVISLTRYCAVYWASFGIRVNCISPGGIYNHHPAAFVEKYSYRTPLGRMVSRDELKGTVVFLASEASSAVTGHNLLVDGGWTAW